MSRIVTLRLMGGLGNQLFQFAAGCYLSTLQEVAVQFDDSWFAHAGRGGATPREFELGSLLSPHEMTHVTPVSARLRYRRGNPSAFVEDERAPGGLDELPSRIRTLQGYFQVARYPLDIRAVLTARLLPVVDRVVPISGASNAIGVHLRLGDYASNPTVAAYHGATSPRYFRDAVQIARADTPDAPVVVFTDSPDLARETGFLDQVGTPVDVVHARTAWETLADLSSCRAIVMSNSSLSWWAALVATVLRARELVVVYPSPWLAAPSATDAALTVPGWRRLSRLNT